MGSGHTRMLEVTVTNNLPEALNLKEAHVDEEWGVYESELPTSIPPGSTVVIRKRGKETSTSGAHLSVEYNVGTGPHVLEIIGSSPYNAREDPQASSHIFRYRTFPRQVRGAFLKPNPEAHTVSTFEITSLKGEVKHLYHAVCSCGSEEVTTIVKGTITVNPSLAPLGPMECDPFTLRVVAYNVFCIPVHCPDIGTRMQQIAAAMGALQPPVDVVVFSEAFGFWEKLAELCAAQGFTHHTTILNSADSQGALTNGGVLIVSRHPFAKELANHESDYVFQSYVKSSNDRHSGKGIKYAPIVVPVNGKPVTVHIFGTHTQATEESEPTEVYAAARFAQARELLAWIETCAKPALDEPVIVAGDLNVDFLVHQPEAEEFLQLIEADTSLTLAPPGANSYGGQYNTLTKYSPEWLDYVVPLRTHLRPTSYEVVALGTSDPESVFHTTSDHYPVLAQLQFGTST